MVEPFHVVIHPAPAGDLIREVLEIDGRCLETLKVGEITEMFDCSFDDVAQAFDQLPRLFLEPDGSFVWVIESDGDRYQLDGGLIDNGIRMLNVELKGICNQLILDRLLHAIGWPKQRLLFQLIQYGVYIAEDEFRDAYVAK